AVPVRRASAGWAGATALERRLAHASFLTRLPSTAPATAARSGPWTDHRTARALEPDPASTSRETPVSSTAAAAPVRRTHTTCQATGTSRTRTVVDPCGKSASGLCPDGPPQRPRRISSPTQRKLAARGGRTDVATRSTDGRRAPLALGPTEVPTTSRPRYAPAST